MGIGAPIQQVRQGEEDPSHTFAWVDQLQVITVLDEISKNDEDTSPTRAHLGAPVSPSPPYPSHFFLAAAFASSAFLAASSSRLA